MRSIRIYQELCKGCNICLELCPQKVFGQEEKISDKGFRRIEVLSSEQCNQCGLCELSCPEMAISIQKGFSSQATYESFSEGRNFGRGRDDGEANGGCKIVKNLIKPGRYLMSGNEACVEAALAGGCRFFAGYPITPASEILEIMAKRMREIGGVCIQAEDEIAALSMVLGAAWAGKKAMTATSGPGFSLKQENISWALMTETPSVIVDVQRAGPSTGQPTRVSSADVMQARWGFHGGSQLIALYPESVQEIYELTIKAFNLSERFRIPVILLLDAFLAHLEESIFIPEEVEIFDRIYAPYQSFFGYTEDFSVPSMPCLGEGEQIFITGLTHNQEGLPATDSPETQEELVKHLDQKILSHKEELEDVEEFSCSDAETIVIAYGSAARNAKYAVKLARNKGIKIGFLRPRIIWPFPDKKIKEWERKCSRFVVIEMNQGQVFHPLREEIRGALISLTQCNGENIAPQKILRYFTEGRWE